jgi:hypothetical protein
MSEFRFALTVVTLFASMGFGPAVTISVVRGLNPVAIPFVSSLNYNATNIFTTPYGGEVIHRWYAPTGAWSAFMYFEELGAWVSNNVPINLTFNPGEGIYYQALLPQTFVANLHDTLVPEILPYPIGPPLPLVPNRYYFQGSPSGQSATYEEIFQAPPNNETALFRFVRGGTDIDPNGPDYRAYYYKDQVWTPHTPILDPLEAVFVVYPYLSLKYTFSGNPGTINFTWPARGKLEQAPLLTGPWELVATDANSYSIMPGAQTNRARYYRVKE